MPANDRCPKCGAPRPATAPAGLCPQCLLRLGLGADMSNGTYTEHTLMDGLSRAHSVLLMLDDAVGPVPRVLLRDAETEAETPVVRPGSGAAKVESSGRYQMVGEIARGGMGAILKGRDTDLGRDLGLPADRRGPAQLQAKGPRPAWTRCARGLASSAPRPDAGGRNRRGTEPAVP